MGLILFMLFVGIPVLEISIFISIGSAIGLWPTLITILATAFIGTILIKRQGLAALFSAQKNFSEGRLPIADIFDGLCIIISGLFLITPGFLTDGIGFLFLFPLFRNLLKKIMSNMLAAQTTTQIYGNAEKNDQTGSTKPVIDGEFEEIHPNVSGKKPRTLK